MRLSATFANEDEQLFPSRFVNVVLLLDTLHAAVRVPVSAVQRGAPGTYVYLVNDGNIVSVHPVKLGAQDGDWIAVESGLDVGARVVTGGADRLRDGVRVSVPGATPASAAPADDPEHHNRRRRNNGNNGNSQNPPRHPCDRQAAPDSAPSD